MSKFPFPIAAALFSIAVLAHSQETKSKVPEGAPSTVAAANAEGNYADEDGKEEDISTMFEKATWGQIFEKLAGENEITWTQTDPTAAGVTGVQADFVPGGAPPAIRVTMFLRSGPDGVRFERMRFARGDESQEKSGLAALKSLAEGYKEGPPTRGSTIAILNKNHARQLILGCLIYAADHDDAYPPDIDALLAADAIEEKLQWRHPETDVKSDFLYHGAGKNRDVPADTVIFAAPVAIEGKRTIARADGAVVDLPEADYQKAVVPE